MSALLSELEVGITWVVVFGSLNNLCTTR